LQLKKFNNGKTTFVFLLIGLFVPKLQESKNEMIKLFFGENLKAFE
jgi:hypothetical protein